MSFIEFELGVRILLELIIIFYIGMKISEFVLNEEQEGK